MSEPVVHISNANFVVVSGNATSKHYERALRILQRVEGAFASALERSMSIRKARAWVSVHSGGELRCESVAPTLNAPDRTTLNLSIDERMMVINEDEADSTRPGERSATQLLLEAVARTVLYVEENLPEKGRLCLRSGSFALSKVVAPANCLAIVNRVLSSVRSEVAENVPFSNSMNATLSLIADGDASPAADPHHRENLKHVADLAEGLGYMPVSDGIGGEDDAIARVRTLNRDFLECVPTCSVFSRKGGVSDAVRLLLRHLGKVRKSARAHLVRANAWEEVRAQAQTRGTTAMDFVVEYAAMLNRGETVPARDVMANALLYDTVNRSVHTPKLAKLMKTPKIDAIAAEAALDTLKEGMLAALSPSAPASAAATTEAPSTSGSKAWDRIGGAWHRLSSSSKNTTLCAIASVEDARGGACGGGLSAAPDLLTMREHRGRLWEAAVGAYSDSMARDSGKVWDEWQGLQRAHLWKFTTHYIGQCRTECTRAAAMPEDGMHHLQRMIEQAFDGARQALGKLGFRYHSRAPLHPSAARLCLETLWGSALDAYASEKSRATNVGLLPVNEHEIEGRHLWTLKGVLGCIVHTGIAHVSSAAESESVQAVQNHIARSIESSGIPDAMLPRNSCLVGSDAWFKVGICNLEAELLCGLKFQSLQKQGSALFGRRDDTTSTLTFGKVLTDWGAAQRFETDGLDQAASDVLSMLRDFLQHAGAPSTVEREKRAIERLVRDPTDNVRAERPSLELALEKWPGEDHTFLIDELKDALECRANLLSPGNQERNSINHYIKALSILQSMRDRSDHDTDYRRFSVTSTRKSGSGKATYSVHSQYIIPECAVEITAAITHELAPVAACENVKKYLSSLDVALPEHLSLPPKKREAEQCMAELRQLAAQSLSASKAALVCGNVARSVIMARLTPKTVGQFPHSVTLGDVGVVVRSVGQDMVPARADATMRFLFGEHGMAIKTVSKLVERANPTGKADLVGTTVKGGAQDSNVRGALSFSTREVDRYQIKGQKQILLASLCWSKGEQGILESVKNLNLEAVGDDWVREMTDALLSGRTCEQRRDIVASLARRQRPEEDPDAAPPAKKRRGEGPARA